MSLWGESSLNLILIWAPVLLFVLALLPPIIFPFAFTGLKFVTKPYLVLIPGVLIFMQFSTNSTLPLTPLYPTISYPMPYLSQLLNIFTDSLNFSTFIQLHSTDNTEISKSMLGLDIKCHERILQKKVNFRQFLSQLRQSFYNNVFQL